VDSISDDPCAIFLGGGTGDESDAANGLGRWVDDVRHRLRFENIELNHTGSGTARAFCLGNAVAAENEGDERLGDIWDSVGGLPSWQGVRVRCLDLYDTGTPQTSGDPDGICDSDATSPAESLIPDHPQATLPMISTLDCGGLAYGARVEVHNAATVDVCLDADADGQLSDETPGPTGAGNNAVCVCDPAGNGGTGRWYSKRISTSAPLCETIFAPNEKIAEANITGVWQAPSDRGMTLTYLSCRSPTGTVTIDPERDDGTPQDILTAPLVCDVDGETACASGCDTTFVDAEDNLAAGETIDLDITAVATDPDTLNVCPEVFLD
jgi:hypothetical protein